MENFKFLNNPQSYNPDGTFVAHLSIVKSKEELFEQLNKKLLFPYFGFNWDALDECLTDFQWIEQHKIVLVHDDMPKLAEGELRMYLDVLGYAIENWQNWRKRPDWKDWKEHSLEVVFPESGKDLK
jgi:hypothetical protein